LSNPAESRTAGEILRDWRRRRRYSQLALALEADISARHLSFLETGRARPSREMLQRLAERLEIPLRHWNSLFLAAGYAPVHSDPPLDDAALEVVRRAAELMLRGLEPYPALLVDRHWTLISGNRTLEVLLAGVTEGLMRPPVNVLRVSFHPLGLAPRIANFTEWRAHILLRLQRDTEHASDPVLAALYDELSGYPFPRTAREPKTTDHPELTVPLRLQVGADLLSFISTTTIFGTAVAPVAAEFAIESFLPADDETARALERMREQIRS
jgi:transcriptional regulator with XRE-family HTH domain